MRLPESYQSVFLVGPERVEVRRVPTPEPGPGEILLRIEAATTCGTDLKVYLWGGHPRMLETPTPFGHEMAGSIAALGSGVQGLHVGQRLVVVNSASCGECQYCLQERQNLCLNLRYLNGAFAEFVLIPKQFATQSTYPIADSLEADLAALTEPLACVMHGLEMCRLEPPKEVLVLGAGPIGLIFVAVLAARGHSVEVFDPHFPRLTIAKALGASRAHLFDRSNPDFDIERRFELCIDSSGSVDGWKQVLHSVRAGGEVLFFGGCPPGTTLELDTALIHYDELTLRSVYHHRPQSVREALAFLEAGSDLSLILTERMPIQAVDRALRSMIARQNLKVVLQPEM